MFLHIVMHSCNQLIMKNTKKNCKSIIWERWFPPEVSNAEARKQKRKSFPWKAISILV